MRNPFRNALDQSGEQVELPREVPPLSQVPVGSNVDLSRGEFVPPRYRSPVGNSRSNAAADLVAAFDQLSAELDATRTMLAEANEDIRRKDAELARLGLDLAKAKNDFDNALTTTQRAVHAATDYRGLVANLRAAVNAMIDNFEVGDAASIVAPSPARKKKKNGEHAFDPRLAQAADPVLAQPLGSKAAYEAALKADLERDPIEAKPEPSE